MSLNAPWQAERHLAIVHFIKDKPLWIPASALKMPEKNASSGDAKARSGRKNKGKRDGWDPTKTPRSSSNRSVRSSTTPQQMVQRIMRSNSGRIKARPVSISRPPRPSAPHHGGDRDVLACLTMPGATSKIRAPAIYGSHTTACATPWIKFTIDAPVKTGAEIAMGGQGFVAISRSPIQHLLWSTVTVLAHKYVAHYVNQAILDPGPKVFDYAIYPSLSANSEGFYMNLEPLQWVYTTTGTPGERIYGDAQFSQDALGHKWYFNGADFYTSFNITIKNNLGADYDGAASESSLLIYRLNTDGSESICQQIDWDAINHHFNAYFDDVGYFRFSVRVGKWVTPTASHISCAIECGGTSDQKYSVIRMSEVGGTSVFTSFTG